MNSNSPKKLITKEDIFLLLVSCVVVFSLGEILFRIKCYFDDKAILSNALATNLKVSDGEIVTIGKIIRLNEDDKIIYELKPDLNVILRVYDVAAQVRTNGNGFRDDEFKATKQHNTLRMIGIGDSFMFGLGVSNGDNYLSVLERNLKTVSSNRWEIFNMAVPGYNTVQEVETLRTKGLKYAPDIVMIGFYHNDFSLPFFIRNKENYFTVSKSFFVQHVREKINIIYQRQPTELIPAPDNDGICSPDGQPADNPERVPSQYRNMVGWIPFKNAMTELKNMSETNNFKVVFVSVSERRTDGETAAIRLANELGFIVIDTHPDIDVFMKNNGIASFTGSILSVGKSDPHPSSLGHSLIADIISNKLQDVLK